MKVCGARMLVAFSLLARAPMAQAQMGDAPRSAASDATDAVRTTFDALPEAQRRALQDALVWTGDYKGAPDGGFGRGTRDALNLWGARMKLPPGGALDEAARMNLLRQGERLRAAAGFLRIVDGHSGAALSLPTKALPRKSETATGTRWTNADGSAQLETFRVKGDDGDAAAMLPQAFERLRTETPTRRVSYRVLRPDFLVVAGEEPRGLFYTRVGRANAAGRELLRGYTLVYARGLAPTFEIYSVAISNGFEPAPQSLQPSAVQPSAPAPVAQAPAGAQPRRVADASAIMVAPNLLVSALTPACTAPRIGERAARIVRRDADTGLALLEVSGLSAPPIAPARPAAAGAAVITLAAARSGDGPANINVAPGDMLAPAAAGQAFRVSAALQDGVGGAAVFNREGGWSAIVLPAPGERRRVAGVLPGAAYRVAQADVLIPFLAAGGVKPAAAPEALGAKKSAGEIASKASASIFGVSCGA